MNGYVDTQIGRDDKSYFLKYKDRLLLRWGEKVMMIFVPEPPPMARPGKFMSASKERVNASLRAFNLPGSVFAEKSRWVYHRDGSKSEIAGKLKVEL